MENFQEKVGFIWSIAELLRGDYKQSEYGKVVLPFTVLRRLDCVLESSKEAVLTKADSLPDRFDDQMKEAMLCDEAGQNFYNLSKFTFEAFKNDPNHIAANLKNYVNGFSSNIQDIFINKFKIFDQIDRLDEANLLYLVVEKFCDIDLHPDKVSSLQMGYIFEELIRRFSEQSNETAGEHFTPREVIRLMVNLLFVEDADALTKKGIIRTLYDPACGTGGMLSVAEEYLRELNPDAQLHVFGQELNAESFAICKSDMLIKGQNPQNIKFGNSFTDDGLQSETFDYFLSNPPFGVEWKKVQKEIKHEHESLGLNGRFGIGLPRVSDGSLLFLQHMISKFKQNGTGSRLAIVFNGSPLFTGSAGSGESEIRRWIIEKDWLEAIVALPDQLFYNTGISTYIWIVTSRKSDERKGKVQLVNASSFFEPMRRSLGDKRHYITDEQIERITHLYGDFEEGEFVKIFDNKDFGYRRIPVERPLRLSFHISDSRLRRLKDTAAFQKLASSKKREEAAAKQEIEEGRAVQQAILSALATIPHDTKFIDRTTFTKSLKKAFKANNVVVPSALLKTIVSSLSERDEEANLCLDSKGNPEPDTELRDFENVPLKEDIHEYVKREVAPHVADIWIDENKVKIGYEINFNRYFYEYKPPRQLKQIQADIRKLERDIVSMLQEVAA